MNDALLRSLASASAACYVAGVQFAWESDLKLAHLLHVVTGDINTFAFAGTMDVQEWLVDLFALQIPVVAHPQLGCVHAGFLEDAESAVYHYILPKLQSLGWPPCYVTGHSKGAAEALLTHGLLKAAGHPPTATYAYEPPRVGGDELAAFLSGDDITWTRTFNAAGDDIVTHVPCGPTWFQPGDPLRLAVPDADDLIAKHKIPAVMTALAALP